MLHLVSWEWGSLPNTRCLSSPMGLHPSLDRREEATVSSQKRQQERLCLCGSPFVGWQRSSLALAGRCRERCVWWGWQSWLPPLPLHPSNYALDLLAPSSAWALHSFTARCKSKVMALRPTYTLQGAMTGQSLTYACKTAQTSQSLRENQEAFTDGSTELHPPSYTVKTNVKIKLVLFNLLNTNHFNPPSAKSNLFPSYFYFIVNKENSLTLVFWTVV